VAVVRDGSLADRAALDRLREGDYILLLTPPEHAARLDRLFLPPALTGRSSASLGDFAFPGSTLMATLAETYGLPLGREARGETAARFLRRRLGHEAAVGDRLRVGAVDLVVREIDRDGVASVGVDLEPADVSLAPRRLLRLWAALRGAYAALRRRRGRTAPGAVEREIEP
jgi:potassium/hydrogen antiporter